MKNKITNEKRANRGFKQCVNTNLASVLVRGFREVGDSVVRILDERRVIIHRSIFVEFCGSITCGGDGLGQVATQLVLGRSALRKVRQEVMDVKVDKVVVGSGLEVTVKEQQEQGRVKHEKGEGEKTER